MIRSFTLVDRLCKGWRRHKNAAFEYALTSSVWLPVYSITYPQYDDVTVVKSPLVWRDDSASGWDLEMPKRNGSRIMKLVLFSLLTHSMLLSACLSVFNSSVHHYHRRWVQTGYWIPSMDCDMNAQLTGCSLGINDNPQRTVVVA